MTDAVKILLDGGRVQLSAHGVAFWTTEGEALMLAHALTERLTIPSVATGKTVKVGEMVRMPSPASKPFPTCVVTGFEANELTVAPPIPKGCGCKSYPHTCHGRQR